MHRHDGIMIPPATKLATVLLRSAVRSAIGISGLSLALNRVVNFLTVNRNISWCIDTKSYLIAAYINYRNNDVVADDDAFVSMSRKDQHYWIPFSAARLPVSWMQD